MSIAIKIDFREQFEAVKKWEEEKESEDYFYDFDQRFPLLALKERDNQYSILLIESFDEAISFEVFSYLTGIIADYKND